MQGVGYGIIIIDLHQLDTGRKKNLICVFSLAISHVGRAVAEALQCAHNEIVTMFVDM